MNALLLTLACLVSAPSEAPEQKCEKSVAKPRMFNWLSYVPPPGFGSEPYLTSPRVFARETLDPLFGSRQPHFMFGVACFKDSDPLKPQPERVIELVKETAAGPLGKFYDKVVILDIEHNDFEDLTRNWQPMIPWAKGKADSHRLEPGAMYKLMWFVKEVKRGLPEYKVGLWNIIPNSRMNLVFKGNVELRDRWWSYNLAIKPLGEVVDFTVPHFYWALRADVKKGHNYYTLAERERGIQLTCMVSHEVYGKPCYPCVWPECYDRFLRDPWPDTEERRRARQWTKADAENTIGACLKYGDGYVLWSQKLWSARAHPAGKFTPFHWNYPWLQVLIDVGREAK